MNVSWRRVCVGCSPDGGRSRTMRYARLKARCRSERGGSMSIAFRRASARLVPLAFAILIFPLAALAQTARPEAVGMSSERLLRVNELVDRYIASGDITGAVTLVARNGRVVHLQAQGVMDATSKKPMQRDTIFRIASMS